ncbi:exosortase B [Hahella sp. NBU794]|uniref:exosortase B n=1 Tax=Hahella sp. NBU794 TaxID=3422590 RepID=UPI003D6F62DC
MQQTITRPHIPAISEWSPVLLGVVVLYLPTYYDLAGSSWASGEQGHEPIILTLVLWFFWKKRQDIHRLEFAPASLEGCVALGGGLVLYVLGRSQDILLFEVGSQIPVVAGLLLLLRGREAVKMMWFPLLFMIFMAPLPGPLVSALTLPMKTAVSWSVDQVLYWAGYPVSRSGVILQVGQYRLLIADACAGLHTLFTLEAMGLFYLHIVRHESIWRNVALAIAIVPISFVANFIRVLALTLITYHYGDEAGQGFLHGFAGIVLFVSALLLIIGVDSILHLALKPATRRRQANA